MELLSLKMRNYRRFDRDTTINFATGEKNVTIIRAENGAGKTGILMALLFGLFGTVHYEQFQIAGDDDYMVSSWLLGENKSAACTVLVSFLEEGSKYTIERTINAANINGHIQQDNNNVVTHLYKDGIDCGWSKKDIDGFMNAIIGENIRGFLFFDGVKYTDLFKQNNSNTKRELAKIIEKMLNINDLDGTIEALCVLGANISNGGAVSTGTAKKLADAKNALNKTKQDISDAEDRRSTLERDIDDYKKRYSALLAEAKNLEGYKEIVDEINTKQNEKKMEEARLDGYLDALTKSTPNYLLAGIYATFGEKSKATFDELAQDKGSLAKIVGMILRENKCLCCDNPLTEEQRVHLKSTLAELNNGGDVPFEVSDRARVNSHHIEDGARSDFDADMEHIVSSFSAIERLVKEIAHLENEFPSDINFTDLSQKMRKMLEDKGSFDALIKGKTDTLDSVRARLNELEILSADQEKKVQSLEEDAALQSGKQKQYQYYETTRKKLCALKERYLREAKEEISRRANEYFLKLLSKDDEKLFKYLKLDGDYGIKVYNYEGREIFGQMSAGQKQFASMAFVMGLTATASDAKPTCNLPLVMDTPFSNLDFFYRKSLIGLMPTVVKQWILTPIDTELTQREIAFFEEGEKVGKVYYLKKDGVSTSLVECNSVSELNLFGGIN